MSADRPPWLVLFLPPSPLYHRVRGSPNSARFGTKSSQFAPSDSGESTVAYKSATTARGNVPLADLGRILSTSLAKVPVNAVCLPGRGRRPKILVAVSLQLSDQLVQFTLV